MSKSVRDHATLRPSLDPIIPDRAGGIQSFLDISRFKDMTALIGLMGPDA